MNVSHQRSVSPMQVTTAQFAVMVSPVKQPQITQQHSSIKTTHSSTVVMPQFPQQVYAQMTPPRLYYPSHSPTITPSTAQTVNHVQHIQSVTSGPSRFNSALDSVCLLGHEMDQMRRNFELVQIELQQWKDKCTSSQSIAQASQQAESGLSPNRAIKLHQDVHAQFQSYQSEINKLNIIISTVNSDLTNSVEKIKTLEKKVGEMNQIELEMLQAKKAAQELDNRNRFQAFELNDLKNKIDTTNQHQEDLFKQAQIVPHLREQLSMLEEENKKLLSIIQMKDAELERSERKQIQISQMYQENLEKTNQIQASLRVAVNENEEIENQIRRTHCIADEANAILVQTSVCLSRTQQINMQIESQSNLTISGGEENEEGCKKAINTTKQREVSAGGSQKRSQVIVRSSSRNYKNNQLLSAVQTTLVEQQGTMIALSSMVKERELRIVYAEQELSAMAKYIDEQSMIIQQLRMQSQADRDLHDEKLKHTELEYSDSMTNQIVPLQKENEQMHHEISELLKDFTELKSNLQELESDKAKLVEQLNIERQESFDAQQELISGFDAKCCHLSEHLAHAQSEIETAKARNKELFDDNKLMAEEMRSLKQKGSDIDQWKIKYRDLKRETKMLRSSFAEYKQQFMRELQARFSTSFEQFEQCLTHIDDRFDSARTLNFNDCGSDPRQQPTQQQHQPTQQQQQPTQQLQLPQQFESVRQSVLQQHQQLQRQSAPTRTVSPCQNRLKQMKLTPSKCSGGTAVVMKSLPSASFQELKLLNNASYTTNPSVFERLTGAKAIGAQTKASQSFSEVQRSSISSVKGLTQGYSQVNSHSQTQAESQIPFQYNTELMETNEILDVKLEELVILKAKYEEALSRVHNNLNSTPQKQASSHF